MLIGSQGNEPDPPPKVNSVLMAEEAILSPFPPAQAMRSSGVETVLEMLQGHPGGRTARSRTQGEGLRAPCQRDLSGDQPLTGGSAQGVGAGGGGPAQGRLTSPTGLHQAVPLPAAVAQQGKGAFAVARDVARGTHVQQLISHLQAGASLQDGVWERRRVSTRLL